MNCPYCNSPKRTETTYECWMRTDMDELQRPEKCLRNEIGLLNDQIRKLKKAGDGMYEFINPPSPCMRTSRMDNLLQGWDDAKININC